MYFTVTVNIYSVKKAPNLLFIRKIGCKEFLNIFIGDISIVLMINFEKYFPEAFSFLFVYFASISNNVLDTLSEK